MKRSFWPILLVMLLAGNLVVSPTGLAPARAATGDATFLSLPGLKAVLIVGPIDGDTGTWTQREIANMELAATFLEAQDVAVRRFYTPNNDWQAITDAARGAHFLLYRGHGPAWNQTPDVGGFALKSRMVTPDEIARDLDLAPNAIVMLYACYSAGSSGADSIDIGSNEARRRVLQYSDAFLDLGIAGYYANWYGDAFDQFLRSLFTGQSLSGAYRAYFDYNPDTTQSFLHPDAQDVELLLDKNNWYGYWQYSNAFVGNAGATLVDLFGSTAANSSLGDIPDRLHFVYSLTEARFLVNAHTVTPKNTASSLVIPWSLSVNAGWVNVTPTSGMTGGNTFTVSPNLTTFTRTATYAGTMTVVCPLTGQTKEIALSLEVIDGSFSHVFLPLNTRTATR